MTRNIVGTSRAMTWEEAETPSRLSAILGIAFGVLIALVTNLMLH